MRDAFDALPEPEKARRRAEVRVLVITGLGLNCEAETEAAFRTAGATPDLVHLLDLLDGTASRKLSDYPVLAFIGGFAFGDHLGAGSVFGGGSCALVGAGAAIGVSAAGPPISVKTRPWLFDVVTMVTSRASPESSATIRRRAYSMRSIGCPDA